jgi:PleD family two-component response regulator
VRKIQALEKDKAAVMHPKILIVDDDEQIRKQIQWALSDEFSVFAAGDRQGAVDASTRSD